MSIDFRCPTCQHPYSVPEAKAGRKVVCAQCSAVLNVPLPEPEETLEEICEPIVFACECGHQMRVVAAAAGKQGKCKQCGARYTVPPETTRRRPKPPKPGLHAQAAAQDLSLDGLFNEALVMSSTARVGLRVQPVELTAAPMDPAIQRKNWRDFLKAMRITGNIFLFLVACIPAVSLSIMTIFVFSRPMTNWVRGEILAGGSKCFALTICMLFMAFGKTEHARNTIFSIAPFLLLGLLFLLLGYLETLPT